MIFPMPRGSASVDAPGINARRARLMHVPPIAPRYRRNGRYECPGPSDMDEPGTGTQDTRQ